ncbi:MAG: FAD-binding oxidoreductase [Beijerinckiaceae bacterium]
MRRAVIASPTSQPLLPRLAGIVGDKHVITDADVMAPHLREWRNLYTGAAIAVVRPGSTAEVSAIMKLAHQTGTPVVPQSGNTGGVGGQVPDGSGKAILLSLARMDKVRDVQPLSNMMTVEAGVILQNLQEAATKADRFFPLSLPSEGSCMIGGNLATNAGGTGVIAYGNTRDLVLGLEVVLPDGRIWNGLSGLRKDNAGYEMKHLFIGSEGTLGVITAATLKLFPRPRSQVTAFIGLSSPAQALQLLTRAQAGAGGIVTAFEVIPRQAIELSLAYASGTRDPLSEKHAWYVLLEVASQNADGLQDAVEAMLAEAFEAGEADDATLSASLDQRMNLWKLREDLPFAQSLAGASIKHDISVPIADVPRFMDEALAMLAEQFPGCRPLPFGHLGDGNLHFNVSQPEGADPKEFLALYEPMNTAMFDIVKRYNGSIAAEHGVGQHKRKLLPRYKDPVALEMMRVLKQSFDPRGIMNPGKVL